MNVSSCARCGGVLAQGDATQTQNGWMHMGCAGYAPQPYAMPGPIEEDKLPTWWLFVIYGTIVVPCVWLPVAILRLVFYYQWQSQYPMKAAELRKHGRIAAAIFLAIWGTLYLINRM